MTNTNTATIIITAAPWSAFSDALARTAEGGRKNFGDWAIVGGGKNFMRISVEPSALARLQAAGLV